MSRTACAATPAWPPCAIPWSSSDSASRTEPSATRAISASASGSAATPSAAQILLKWAIIGPDSMRRKSKRMQRERTVIGTFSISVVAKRNLTCSGGSSSVFSRPLKACFESMCTSSMM